MRSSRVATAAVITSLMVVLGAIPVAAQSPAPLLADPTLVRYEDAVGDVDGGPGPDIVAVTVSQPDRAGVSIGVEFASEPPISYSTEDDPYWTDMLSVFIGTGAGGVAIGPEGGLQIDFGVGLHGATLPRHLDEGVDLHGGGDMLEGAVQVTVDGPTLTLTFPRESLGDPERMMFVVVAEREIGNAEEGGGQDVYPENDGAEPFTQIAWTFEEA
jgi:hypothetical protein